MNAFVSLAVPLERVAVSVTDALPFVKAGRVTTPLVETTLALLELQVTFTPLLPEGRVMFPVTEVAESPLANVSVRALFTAATSSADVSTGVVAVHFA